VTLSPEGGGFQGAVDYNALLLPRAGVEQVVDRFRSTLSAALVDPGRRLSELLMGEPH